MNIHLMIDSSYTNNFIEYLKKNDELNNNKVILIHFYPIKHIKEENIKIIKVIQRKSGYFKSSNEFKELCSIITSRDRVFAHYLTTEDVWAINNTNAKEYNWVLWGGDFYPYIKQEQYDSDTKSVRDKYLPRSYKGIRTKFQEYISYKLRKKAIKKIDFILTWNEPDYKLLCDNFTTTARLKSFVYPGVNDYGSLDKIIENNIEKSSTLTIQLGNSGDSTNNHISVLKKLAKYKEEDFKVIVPLSYGEEWYIEEVIRIGVELLGDKFVPITDFMPLDEYRKLLGTIDVAIMNHFRQQGVGNIASLIYLGKKVYLNKDVTTYKSFKEWGIQVYDTEKLLDGGFQSLRLVDDVSVRRSREIIKSKFNNKIEL